MAGPIQLGDALRLAELAWTVWEYGWAEEHNAGWSPLWSSLVVLLLLRKYAVQGTLNSDPN